MLVYIERMIAFAVASTVVGSGVWALNEAAPDLIGFAILPDVFDWRGIAVVAMTATVVGPWILRDVV